MTKPNKYATMIATVVWVVAAAAAVLIWSDGHGGKIPEAFGAIVLPGMFLAVPGPFLLALIFKRHMSFAVVMCGLVFDWFIYWLLIRGVILTVSFCRRKSHAVEAVGNGDL